MLNRNSSDQRFSQPRPGARWHGKWAVVLLIVTATLVATPTLAAPPAVNGTLTRVGNLPVLKVWGNPYQQGYAHGYLLGEEILHVLDNSLFHPNVLRDPNMYERSIANDVMANMSIRGAWQQELQGMLDGMVAKLGHKRARSDKLHRDLEVKDLAAFNTLADWYRIGCSSYAVWGDLATEGGIITGRNLDFMDLPGIRTKHVLIVRIHSGSGRKSWASLAWPGLIGAYTAMNEDGVTVAMHDAQSLAASGQPPFVSRSLALREIVEQASAKSAIDDATKILKRLPAMVGNNFMVTSPFTGQEVPAAVFEYDSVRATDGGVTVRTAADNGEKLPTNAIICTNHYRKRAKAVECRRYTDIADLIGKAADAKKPFTPATGWSMLEKAAVSDTLHSVVFLPNIKELEIALSSPGTPATRNTHLRLKLEELIRR